MRKTVLLLAAGLVNLLLAGSFLLGTQPSAVSRAVHFQSTPGPTPDPGMPTPSPEPDPGDLSPGQGEPGVVTQVFKIVFSADSLSEALARAFSDAAEVETQRMAEAVDQVAEILTDLLSPPDQHFFASIAASSLRTAAVIAPALFMVRLALYHWTRLFSEEDGLARVFGDWLAAGFLAAAAGPFLDLLVQAGWWAAGAALGEANALAGAFVDATIVRDAAGYLSFSGKPSLFAVIFTLGGGLGGLLGITGLAFAFAVSQAVLFVLAVLAPVLAVMSVIPQMRWFRSLWLKAVAVLALLPVAAGGIFKAGLTLAAFYGDKGLAGLLIRLLWLWGAVGFLFSLAGILGRVTLSTAVDAAGQFISGVQMLISTGQAAMTSAGHAAMGGAAASSPGFQGAHAAAASQAPLMPPPNPGSGYTLGESSPGAVPGAAAERKPSAGTPTKQGFSGLARHVERAGLDPVRLSARFPEEAAAMEEAYARFRDRIDLAPDPLIESAKIAGSSGIIGVIQAKDPNGGSHG